MNDFSKEIVVMSARKDWGIIGDQTVNYVYKK